jgi:hypothetical protein
VDAFQGLDDFAHPGSVGRLVDVPLQYARERSLRLAPLSVEHASSRTPLLARLPPSDTELCDMGVDSVCFVVMPFGRKPLLTETGKSTYDFDKVYRVVIQRAVKEAGLVPIRAELIHTEMFRDLRGLTAGFTHSSSP